MTYRAEILQAIQTQLSTLTIANGYTTDVGLNVRYWQDLPIEYDGPPTITFFDEKDDPTEVGALHEHRLSVRIDAIAYINANANAIIESCNLLSDIVTLIGKNRRWAPAVINTYLGENLKEIELKAKLAVRVTQEFEIQYRAPFFKI